MPVETRAYAHELVDHCGEFNDSALERMKGCLEGESFCLAGVHKQISRTTLENLIRHCGGECSGSRLLRKNTFMIRGDYVGDHIHHPVEDHVEDEEIFKTAQDRNIEILNMEGFIRMLAKRNPGMKVDHMLHPEFPTLRFHKDSVPHPHKYSLDIAPTNRSKCHGRCHGTIAKGAIRLKYSAQPPDEWVHYRNLECITPAVLGHIELDWIHHGGLKEFFKAQSDEVREALKCYCCPDSAGEVKKPFEVCATEYLHSLAKHNTEQPDASIAPDGRVEEIDTDTEPITEASDEPMLKRARTGDIPIRTDEIATTPMTEMSQEMRDFLGLMHIPQAGESGMIAALSNGATMEDMAISRDFKITSTTEETTNEFGKTFVTTMEKQCNMTMDAARPTHLTPHIEG